MRQTTATSIIAQYSPPPVSHATEAAGPCLIVGCGGQLEIRHERQFGKVYVICPECERRVRRVERLTGQIAQLTAQRDHLHKRLQETEVERQKAIAMLTPALRERAARQAATEQRELEIERRYLANESLVAIASTVSMTAPGVAYVLKRRGVTLRRRVRQAPGTREPRSHRSYKARSCEFDGCGTVFTPTGPRSVYCSAHDSRARRAPA